MDLAFLYIAEAYQCYHGEAIAIELAKQSNVRVTTYYADHRTPEHVDRIRRAFGAAPATLIPLRRSLPTQALQSLRWLGAFKDRMLGDNREQLNRHDAIIAVENTVAAARSVGIGHPKLIYSPHGFGDRAYSFVPRIAQFDFVLLAGNKTEQRMLRDGLIRRGDYALTGSIKLETGAQLHRSSTCQFQDQPTVLYNPHFAPELTSWPRFIEPMLNGFEENDEFSLIVAPHIKMFRRHPDALRRRWEERSTRMIRIDTGSTRSVDSDYLFTADIYVGDSSSQVYEFLSRPRPCVFLNAHGVRWREDPNFAHWHLGDVVDRPDDLMPAIRAASGRHHIYRPLQVVAAAASLGPSYKGASARAAEAILAYLVQSV